MSLARTYEEAARLYGWNSMNHMISQIGKERVEEWKIPIKLAYRVVTKTLTPEIKERLLNEISDARPTPATSTYSAK